MGETTGSVNQTNATPAATGLTSDPAVKQIVSNIVQTRAEMSETIAALQEKLDPERLKEQVKHTIKERATEAYDSAKQGIRQATVRKAEQVMANVSDTFSDFTQRTGTAVKDGGTSVAQYARQNSIPLALVGVGLGMLAYSSRRNRTYEVGYGSDLSSSSSNSFDGVTAGLRDRARAAADATTSAVSSATQSVRDAANSATDTAREQFGKLSDTATQQLGRLSDTATQRAQVARDQVTSTWNANPLAVGIAALAAGAILGTCLPSTQVEQEYMGDARDQLLDRAKSAARDTMDKVQHVAEEATNTVKEVAEREGLTQAAHV